MDKSEEERLRNEGEALLAWLNILPFFRQEDDLTSEDLSNGTKLWEALQVFSPEYFSDELPRHDGSIRRRTSHVQNLQNMKKIHRTVRQYIVQALKIPLPPGFEDMDPNAMSEGSSIAEFSGILKAMFYIAVLYTEYNEAYITVIQTLPENQQAILMLITQELQSLDDSPAEAYEEEQEVDVPAVAMDKDVQNDEYYIKLLATTTTLEKQKGSLKKDLEDRDFRLSRLQENNAALQKQLEEAQSSLDHASQDVDQSYRLHDMEAKNKSQDDYIASLEEQMQSLQEKDSGAHAELNRLRKASEKMQPLQDEIDELRAARDSLLKRNNTLERVRHKVQIVQDIEGENRALRREIEEMREAYDQGDGAKATNISLQREVMELKTLMSNTEIQLVESANRKKQLEYEVTELVQRLEEAAAQRERDQETLAGMRDATAGLDDQDAEALLDLNRELESSNRQEIDKDENIKTKYERAYKFSNNEVARGMALQKLYQEEKVKNAALQRRNIEVSKKILMLQAIMKQPDAPEHAEAFTQIQSDLESANAKLETLERELAASQSNIADAEKTIALYDQEKAEAVEALKDLNSEEVRELQARLITLDTRNTELRIELDESRILLGQVGQSFQNAGNTAPPVEAPQEAAEIKDDEGEETAAASQHVQELTTQVEDAKERERAQEEIQLQQEQTIKELREEIRKATDKAAPSLLKASEQAGLKKEIENLRRENKLMSTAFFDLSNRLQMNNVSLQRRSEAPKGFLNRQRQLVNQATSIRTR